MLVYQRVYGTLSQEMEHYFRKMETHMRLEVDGSLSVVPVALELVSQP